MVRSRRLRCVGQLGAERMGACRGWHRAIGTGWLKLSQRIVLSRYLLIAECHREHRWVVRSDFEMLLDGSALAFEPS